MQPPWNSQGTRNSSRRSQSSAEYSSSRSPSFKNFSLESVSRKEENNAYRNRKLYCPILPPLCIGKRITWEPKDSCFPISAGRLIGSLIVSHVHTTTAGYCILYISIYYERETLTKKVIILIHLLSEKKRPVLLSTLYCRLYFILRHY